MKIDDVLKTVGKPTSIEIEVTPDHKLKQIAKYVIDDNTDFVVLIVGGSVVSVTKNTKAE